MNDTHFIPVSIDYHQKIEVWNVFLFFDYTWGLGLCNKNPFQTAVISDFVWSWVIWTIFLSCCSKTLKGSFDLLVPNCGYRCLLRSWRRLVKLVLLSASHCWQSFFFKWMIQFSTPIYEEEGSTPCPNDIFGPGKCHLPAFDCPWLIWVHFRGPWQSPQPTQNF